MSPSASTGKEGGSVHAAPLVLYPHGSSSSSSPEFVAVILCGTSGARMYPLSSDPNEDAANDDAGGNDAAVADAATGDDADAVADNGYRPKHLLPVAGVPLLVRTLLRVQRAGFRRCVVAVSAFDRGATLRTLRDDPCLRLSEDVVTKGRTTRTAISSSSSGSGGGDTVLFLRELPAAGEETTEGSADALLDVVGAVDETDDARPRLVSSRSHVIVAPSDLVLLDGDDDGGGVGVDPLTALANAHRRGASRRAVALTALLADVGDEDEKGAPLKESGRQKKGGLARDDEDVEYVVLGTVREKDDRRRRRRRRGGGDGRSLLGGDGDASRRILLKRSRPDVEENEDNDGSTPKIVIPKYRLRECDDVVLTTDLSDLHVYAVSPWVLRALEERRASGRTDPRSLREELLPLLLHRQFSGAEEVAGRRRRGGDDDDGAPEREADANDREEDNDEDEDDDDQHHHYGHGSSDVDRPPRGEFVVLAHVLPRPTTGHAVAVRASTVPAYLFACRELLARASSADSSSSVLLPPERQLQAKARSLLLSGASVGEKTRLQNATVGAGVKIGARCRLNNVVLLDDAVVGDNCVLQNTVIGHGATVGDNCSLNDCQIGPGAEVEKGRKSKGESVTKELRSSGW